MRIAGVRLTDDVLVWLDAGDLALVSLGYVRVRLATGEQEGQVFATPDQVLTSPFEIDGVILESQPPNEPDTGCDYLPGAEFPTLGQMVRRGEVQGRVVALDPVDRRVTISPDGSAPIIVPLAEITDD